MIQEPVATNDFNTLSYLFSKEHIFYSETIPGDQKYYLPQKPHFQLIEEKSSR
jgi:hypothetical protein